MTYFKKHYIISLIVLFVFTSCKDENQILHLSLENSLGINRPNTVVKVNVKEYFRGDEFHTKKLVLTNNGNRINRQFIDYDFDGQIDEMVFQLDFNKYVSQVVELEYQEESILLENIKSRGTEISLIPTDDLFKTINHYEYVTNEPEREPLTFNFGGPMWKNSIHQFHNDFYNNKNYFQSSSLIEVGSLNLMVNDSIYSIKEAAKNNFHILTNGPVISTFQLEYLNLLKGDNNYSIKQQIEIQKAKNYFENTISINGFQESDKLILQLESQPNSTKLIDYYNQKLILNEYRMEDSSIIYIGLLIESDVFSHLLNSDKGKKNYVGFDQVVLNIEKNVPIKYRLYILETTATDINDEIDIIKTDIEKSQKPIIVRLHY